MAKEQQLRELTATIKSLQKQIGNLDKRIERLEQKTTPEQLSRDIGKYLARQTQRPTTGRVARY